MDHAINLTREDRIRFGIRPGMSQIGVWTAEAKKIDSPVARVCAEVCAYNSSPIVGWTKGIQWVVFGGSVLNVRMFIGTKRFSFFVENQIVAIYADDGIFPIIALLIEEIHEDILAQHERLDQCPKVITDFASAAAGLRAEIFPRWSGTVTREAKEDPLHKALYAKYEAEYQAAEAGFHKRMRDALFFMCKTRGARYVSISPTLFCVLEDVKTDGVNSKPVPHQIAEDLNIFAGSYESFGVRTMNLSALCGQDIKGVWRVDGDEPIRVTKDVIAENFRGYRTGNRAILSGMGDMDETEWLKQCKLCNGTFRY